MLICNNCDSENRDGAVKCQHCNMEGNFTYLVSGKSRPVVVTVDRQPLACSNCGCESPGNGEKCIDCHFPNPRARKTNGQALLKNPPKKVVPKDPNHLIKK